MLYNEFLQGTGCRQTDHNYEIYRKVDAMYMNVPGMTKDEAYAIGKKLVDNSLTNDETEELHRLSSRNKELRFAICSEEKAIKSARESIAISQSYIKQLRSELNANKAIIKGLQELGKRR